jgi:hypothetical protein
MAGRTSARAVNKKVLLEMAWSWVEMGGVAAGEWWSFGGFGMALLHR